MSFPLVNEELEPASVVAVDRSLIQAACAQLKKLPDSADDQVLLNLQAILDSTQDNVQVAIEMHFGLINRVASNVPVNWVLIDNDIEGCDPTQVVSRPGLDDQIQEVFNSAISASVVMPDQVEKIFKHIHAEGQ